jgi:hypothetical protein
MRRRCCCLSPECFDALECVADPAAPYAYVSLPYGWEQPARDNHAPGCWDLDDYPVPNLDGNYVLSRSAAGPAWQFESAVYGPGPPGVFHTWVLTIGFGLSCSLSDMRCHWTAEIWLRRAVPDGVGLLCGYHWIAGGAITQTDKARSTWQIQLNDMVYYDEMSVSVAVVTVGLALQFQTDPP